MVEFLRLVLGVVGLIPARALWTLGWTNSVRGFSRFLPLSSLQQVIATSSILSEPKLPKGLKN